MQLFTRKRFNDRRFKITLLIEQQRSVCNMRQKRIHTKNH